MASGPHRSPPRRRLGEVLAGQGRIALPAAAPGKHKEDRAIRTNDLDPGEDRRRFGRRWAWFDPVVKSRVWGCQPCRAALPREGLDSRAPVVAAAPTPDLAAEPVRAVETMGGRGCQAATIVR
jgi:hypothetical protein